LEAEDLADGGGLRDLAARGARARAAQRLLAVAQDPDPRGLLAAGRSQLDLELVADPLAATGRALRLAHLPDPRAREGAERGLDLRVRGSRQRLRRPLADREPTGRGSRRGRRRVRPRARLRAASRR